jgi:DNA modification methylase
MRTEQLAENVTCYLADCREILATISADVLITDPPYGVNLGKHNGANAYKGLQKNGYLSYEDSPENYQAIVVPAIGEALRLTKRAAVFGYLPAMWNLPSPDIIGGFYLPSGQGLNRWGFTCLAPVLFYGTYPGSGKYPTTIENSSLPEKTGHPVTKPLAWMKWLVGLASLEGETVLDPFMGSGATGIAALELGRAFIGIEIEPKYFDIACKRITNANRQLDLFRKRPAKQIPLEFTSVARNATA